MNQEVYFVDSFTSELFRGNPAGVIFYTEAMSSGLMQKIAAENNLSETAFIDINNNEIRFFTPEIEVDLCGHATLASAFIYFNFINTEKNEVTFHSKRGSLVALKAATGIQISLPRDTLRKVDNHQLFEDALNVRVNELYRGIDDYLVILDSEDTVKNLEPNFELLKEIDARVACPQRSTSISGVKNRISLLSISIKAVSESLFSAAIFCIRPLDMASE